MIGRYDIRNCLAVHTQLRAILAPVGARLGVSDLQPHTVNSRVGGATACGESCPVLFVVYDEYETNLVSYP